MNKQGHDRRTPGGIGHVRPAWSALRRSLIAGTAVLGMLSFGIAGAVGMGPSTAGAASRVQSVYRFATYVGGHGKASTKLSPVTIGIVNQQTSTHAPGPRWTTGAIMAEKYINHETHGIDGHPLHVVACKIATTVATATKCGQQFANDKAIAAVVAGPIAVGSTALESALAPAKKPIFWGIALLTAEAQDKYGVVLDGDVTTVLAPFATYARTYLHAKSVSITFPSNTPGQVQGANIEYTALERAGITNLYKVGFTSADTNLSEPFQAAHVGSTTMLIAQNTGGSACSNTYKTLKSLGVHTKVVVNLPCDTATVAKGDGGQLPAGWYYSSASPVPGGPTKAIPSAEKIFAEFGHPKTDTTWVLYAFAQVLTVAKLDTELLKAHQAVTPAKVLSRAKAFKGPMVLGPPHLDCGGITRALPALCTDTASLYKNTRPGVMKPIALWVGPPKGFKVGAAG
jgi:ABC-type branched-subunit amino acid transport system substrate-binding protein